MAIKKVIVTAAITGGIHTPTMSPYLPKGPEEIAQQAIDAAKAGAAIVHIHARTEKGEPTADSDIFEKILTKIKKNSDVVVGITTGGAQGMTVEERFSVLERFKPEMASANCGTMNFNISKLADGKEMENPVYDWEVPFLKRTIDTTFKNTFKDMEYMLKTMRACGTFPEFEIFDYGQLVSVAHFKQMGLTPNQIYLQFVLGVMGGMPMSLDGINFMIDQAKKMVGQDIMYSMVAGGRRMFRYEALSAITGGNCRVGLEDGIYIKPNGELAVDNAAQVTKIIKILNELDFETASSDEVRETFGLKGKNQVGY